jgi:hypothetical protein
LLRLHVEPAELAHLRLVLGDALLEDPLSSDFDVEEPSVLAFPQGKWKEHALVAV